MEVKRTDGLPQYQKVALTVLFVAALLSCIRPIYPREMYMQHFPTVVILVVVPLLSSRFPLSNAAMTCLVLFMLLHVIGARYIYSYVPYDRWSEQLLGINISDRYAFRRNHYDRVVHFFFGLLWVRPVWEVCVKYLGVPRRFAYYTALEFVLAFSMLYELFEWGITMVLSPDDANRYNGQQGDMWDSQKDMSLAFLGSVLALTAWGVRRRMAGRTA